MSWGKVKEEAMSDEERSLVHSSEFLAGDSAGTNPDRVTDVAAHGVPQI